MENHVIVYHKNCNDGICAAAIINTYLGNDVNKSFIPMNYNDAYSFDINMFTKDTTLWIVDFSFPMDKMWELNNMVKKVFWFDHHITPLGTLIDDERLCNVTKILDVNRSGAGITWDSLYKVERPKIVNAIEDRDLWKFKYNDTRELCEGFSAMVDNPTDEIFIKLFYNNNDILTSMKNFGILLRKNNKNIINKALTNGFYGTFMGELAFFVNTTDNISEIGEAIYTSTEDPIVAVMYRFTGNDTIMVSLRSKKVDVEKLAKKYPGGGGHPGAAGFAVKFDWGNLRTTLSITEVFSK